MTARVIFEKTSPAKAREISRELRSKAATEKWIIKQEMSHGQDEEYSND
jgi:hypothetical protein